MQALPSNTTVDDSDDGVRPEDLFRRATFHWAVATKDMVARSVALSPTTKVARAALADIKYARDMLDDLFVPTAVKPPAVQEGETFVKAEEVKQSVSDLAARLDVPLHLVPPLPETEEPEVAQMHRGVDLSAPVYPKGGKMLWAGVDCPTCESKAEQRCRTDGRFMEKPHAARKALAEKA